MMSTQRNAPGVGPGLARGGRRTKRPMMALFVASLVAYSLALGGCGGGGASAAASASTAPTASPSAAWTAEQLAKREAALATPPPEKPENMNENSEAGAIATAEYYIQLYPYAYATGDLELLGSITRDDCEFCNIVIRDIKEYHDKGGWKEPWNHTVTQAKYVLPAPKDIYPDCPRVYVSFDQEGGYIYKNPGEDPKVRKPKVAARVIFAMKYEGGRWLIREVDVL